MYEDFKDFLEDDGETLGEIDEKLTSDMTELFKDLQNSYEQSYDINERLAYDDKLQEEFVLCSSMLSMLELAELDNDDLETTENAYLKIADICFRLSKVLNPLAGVGLDWLVSGYDYINHFEAVHHPLLTKVTKNNIASFKPLLSEKAYDDVYYGRYKALGALRRKDGNEYGAGILVYYREKAPIVETPVIRIEYLYVADEFRNFGTGNLLMASLLRMALQDPETCVTVSVQPLDVEDIEDEEFANDIGNELDILDDFLNSWKFSFTPGLSSDFYFALSDIEFKQIVSGKTRNVKSLEELGKYADRMVEKFFKEQNNIEDADFLDISADYYDGGVSCAVVDNNTIKALLLGHRYESGDYRLDFIRAGADADARELIELLRYAYALCKNRGDEDAVISGPFSSESGYELLLKTVPKAKRMLSFNGLLCMPAADDVITGEQWNLLRKRAGYEPKINEADVDESIIDEDQAWNELEEFLNTMTQK